MSTAYSIPVVFGVGFAAARDYDFVIQISYQVPGIRDQAYYSSSVPPKMSLMFVYTVVPGTRQVRYFILAALYCVAEST